MQKVKKRYIIIIIILVCIILFIINSIKYDFLQEDLLFFQFLNSSNESRNISKIDNEVIEEKIEKEETNINVKTIYFHVQYQNRKLKTVNLTDTVDNKTLVYEKIAPGTSGRFDILLNSNQNMNYKIVFESENEKPTNLQFYTLEDNKKYTTLEELGENLTGTILKNEQKNIPVYWEWIYEANQEQNKQDTLEAKRIREYHFLIYVQGY